MRLLFVMLIAAALAACATGNNSADENASDPDVIEGTGTVQFIDLEGGFYGIVADDGSRYDPSDLPAEFQEDGLRVEFRAERREGVVTMRMWGQVVRLIEIERL